MKLIFIIFVFYTLVCFTESGKYLKRLRQCVATDSNGNLLYTVYHDSKEKFDIGENQKIL